MLGGQKPAPIGSDIASKLIWVDAGRDTRLCRAAVDHIRAEGKPVYCVWAGQRLRDEYDVDRCFPFASWPCDDTWNLMPASTQFNDQRFCTNHSGQALVVVAPVSDRCPVRSVLKRRHDFPSRRQPPTVLPRAGWASSTQRSVLKVSPNCQSVN